MANILIIDDDPSVCQFLCDLMLLEGYSPISALDLNQGQKLFKDADLVLLDFNLGNGTGADLLATARLEGHATPVIVITGSHDLGAVKACMADLGVFAYLPKPPSVKQLSALVRSILTN